MAQESKESSQRANVVLQTGSLQALAGFGDIGFDMTGLDVLQGESRFLQVLEEALRCIPVAGDRRCSEPPYLAQIVRILSDQHQGGRSRCCGRGLTINDQALRGQISSQSPHGSCAVGTDLDESLPVIVKNRVG